MLIGCSVVLVIRCYARFTGPTHSGALEDLVDVTIDEGASVFITAVGVISVYLHTMPPSSPPLNFALPCRRGHCAGGRAE